MTPETPMLMITLLIPLQADISAEQVLEAIGGQLTQALAVARQQAQQEEGEAEEGPVSGEMDPELQAFKESLIVETQEGYTNETRDDLLSQLGYSEK